MKTLRKKIDEMERIYTEGILFIDKLEMKQERLAYFHIKGREGSAPHRRSGAQPRKPPGP